MLDQFEILTDDMPSEMRTLLADYPRDDWEAHPGFKERTRQWMGAHQMFRRLGGIIGKETELYLDKSQAPDELDKSQAPDEYAERLSYYGDALVRNLHGHHHWEDDNYFPELSAADSRFDAGLEILEKDHQALDMVLNSFTRTANRTIKLIQLDEVSAREEAGTLLKTAETIEAFLQRHLSDEEELAVPIILHHRLWG